MSILLSVVMVIGMLPVGQTTAFASDTIYYIDAKGNTQTCNSYTAVTSGSAAVTWSDGWYVVKGGTEAAPIAIKGVTVSGNVNLILLDGCHFTVTGASNSAGICVSGSNNSLTIYAGNIDETITGTGTLNATGGTNGAGIGGGNNGSGSNITINGGTVTANGGLSGAGIGGGKQCNGSNITINGGTVTATGGTGATGGAAGIGGGRGKSGSNITITGGTVTATGGNGGAGIGNGEGCSTDASNIKAAASVVVKAGDSESSTMVIEHNDATDLSTLADFKGKQYVTVEEPTYVCQIGSTKYATVQAAVDAVQANETIQMIADVDLTATITIGGQWKKIPDFTLDLNGHVLNAGNIEAPTTSGALACVIYTYNSGNLTITDSDSDAAHTNWNDTHPTSEGNADLSGVKGGVLTGGKGRNYTGIISGGAIYNSQTLTMSGGTITGNTATNNGGGVYNNDTFTMTGGTISGNTTTTTNGGGVYNKDTFTITGGEITDNTGHGVYNASNKLTIGGNAKISGNKVKVTDTDTVIKNLFLPSGKKITISSTTPLSEGASIGITTESDPTAQPVILTNSAQATDAQYFHSDDTNYTVLFNTDHLELAVQYTVTFDVGEHGKAPTPEKVVSGGKVTKPTDPTESGYAFAGWYTEQACTTAWNFDTDTVKGNTTLHAKWLLAPPTTPFALSPTEKGGTNGKIINVDNTMEYKRKDGVGYIPVTGTEIAGIGLKEGDKVCVRYQETAGAPESADVELTIPHFNEFEVTFNMNGHGEQIGKATASTATPSIKDKKPEDPTAAGWIFKGWFADSALQQAWNFVKDYVTKNLELFAKWLRECTVTYNANKATAGTVPEDETTYEEGQDAVVLGNTGNLTRKGYTFSSWNTAADGSGTAYQAGDTFTIEDNTVLYADWTRKSFSVSYDANGATGGTVPAAGTYKYEDSVTVPDNTGELEKTGYTFSGWNTAADGRGTTYKAGETFAIEEDTVLYARWTAKMSYDANGATAGTAPVDDSEYLEGETATVLGNTGSLRKSGYVFAGWNTSADGKGTGYKAGDRITVQGDMVLYAKWTENNDDDNGSKAYETPKKTGTWNDPVTNGTWTKGSDGKWMYKTNADFKNTWGYIQYTDRNGIVQTGWFWFDANGYMVTGWVQVNGSWFYFDETEGGTLGLMKQGWVTWNGGQYYLTESKDSNGGKMLANTTTPDGHVVDETGKMIR